LISGQGSPAHRAAVDVPVRKPNQPPPRPAGVPGGERAGPDLVHVVAARRLAPDDLPDSANRLGAVDRFAAKADPERGGSAS
jgi:hypothetical protein